MVALDNVALSTANLTITGTKDLTGDNKKQVLFSLTTTDDSSTAMSTFADLNYTSVVVTAYKNGTDSTNPLEETPLYTRTFQGTQLNKAAINLDITHEATVGDDSEFQANTNYVFEARFIKNTGGTISLELVRTIHLFQDAPNVANYEFEAQVDVNAIGLTVTTLANAPAINEVFVEIMKLDGTEPLRDENGVISVYSLKKYTTDTSGEEFASPTSDTTQTIRATNDASLPNSTDADETLLITAKAYNMNVIVVTNGGTSEKIRVTPSGSTNTTLLLASKPHNFKQTFIDEQKVIADFNNTGTKNTLPPSMLQVLEITPLSTSEVLDNIALSIDMDGETKSLTTHSGYTERSNDTFAAAFETDLVTSVTQGEGADAFTRKVMAIRYTKASSASDTTIIGDALGEADSDLTVNYPTKVSTENGFQDRRVAQICTEDITFYNNRVMGVTTDSNKTLGSALANDGTGGTVINIKVLYVQVTDLDFGILVNNVSTTLSNSSNDSNSDAITKFVERTNVTGVITESNPSTTTSFNTIKMDLPTDTNNTTRLASNTLRVTQNELNAAGDQSFILESTDNLLEAFVDADNMVNFVQLTLDDSSGTYKSFTLDGSTTPTALEFLRGDETLTLTHGVAFGSDPDAENAPDGDTYGVLPESSGAIPPSSANIKPYGTRQSIAFDSASIVSQVHLVVHVKGYNYGTQLLSGNMEIRYELPSLVNRGSGAIVNYADPNGDGNQSDAVSIYGENGAQYDGSIYDAGKISEAAWSNNITAESAGKTSLYSGPPRSAMAFPAMGRVPLRPTVEATQASKAVLPNGGVGVAFTLIITEDIKAQEFSFPGVAGANGDIAPYDLTVADNRPSTATIILRKSGSGSTTDLLGTTPLTQTFIINLTGTQTTSQGVDSAFTTTAANGTTAGVYSVILENGRTLGVDENNNAATVTFSPGDRLEVILALGNATYGTSPLTYISGSGGNADHNGTFGPDGANGSTGNGYYLTRFDTMSGDRNNGGDRLPVNTNKFLDFTSAEAQTYDANGVAGGNAVGSSFIDIFGINSNRSAGPIVGAPTVTLGAENRGNDVGVTGRFIFNVVANANDIDQRIDYTQLEVELTVNSGTPTTHILGTFGTALATALSETQGGLTVNSKGDYTVTFNSGEIIGVDEDGNGASATFVGGDIVSARARLRTDYDQVGTLSDPTTNRTIRTNATLKNAGTGGVYLNENNALFDVDLIDKTTIRLAPYYANHGIENVSTWDDIITLNGNSVGDLTLEAIVRYQIDATTYQTFDAIGGEVTAFTQSVTIADGGNFAALISNTEIELDLGTSRVNALKNRLNNDPQFVKLRIDLHLKTTFDNGVGLAQTVTGEFTPYLEKLALDSVEAVSAEGDTLTWRAKFTPEAYKTNLNSVKMELAIQKNNIATHTLALANATSNNNAIQVSNVTLPRTNNNTTLSNDGTESFVTFITNLSERAALRGSYIVPKLTVFSTASNDSYNENKSITDYDNDQNSHVVADSDFTTRAAQKLASRAPANVAQEPIVDGNNQTHFSMVPNGNTSGVILTVDNDGAKQLGLGFIAGQADQTNAIGEFINNNPFNAVFGVEVTLTIGTNDVDETDTTSRVFRFGGAHNLTITPHNTKVGNVLSALNAMPIFPATMELPGVQNGAVTDVWSLHHSGNPSGNVEIIVNGTVQSNTNATITNKASIHLHYESSVGATSKVSYVAVTHESGGTDAGAGVTLSSKGNNFILLSDLDNAEGAKPLPTLVVPISLATGRISDAIFAQTGISNTISTTGQTNSVSSIATTDGVTIG